MRRWNGWGDDAVQLLLRVQQLCAQEAHWDEMRWNQERARYDEVVRAHYAMPA